tara:strand:- start:156 stop:302 length:147 start_codon:yes stop_codon:yes gene_type:complete
MSTIIFWQVGIFVSGLLGFVCVAVVLPFFEFSKDQFLFGALEYETNSI